MEPYARRRHLPLVLAACLALVATLGLTAAGRAAGQAIPPLTLATSSSSNIHHSRAVPDGADWVYLTLDDNEDTYPALSSDGQQLVFARSFRTELSYETGRELYRVNADGGLQRLTDNDLVESWPTFSPNAAWLAFAADDLYVMPFSVAGGGPSIKLTVGGLKPRNLAWSPDGTQLAFNSWPCVVDYGNCATAELYVVTVPDGQLTRLTNNAIYDGDPAWSPDGARLVYETGMTDAADLALVPAAGGAATPLLSDQAYTFDPAWSPDGAFIAFGRLSISIYGQYTYEMALIHPDGSGQRALGEPDGSREKFEPAWSADSQTVYYLRTYYPSCPTCGPAYDELVRVGVAPGGAPVPIATLNTYGPIYTAYFALSIAGNRLVYVSYESLIETDLTPNAATQTVTSPPIINGDPTWSPDGQRLAFSSQRDFDYNIHLIDADGNNRAALTSHPGNDWNPTWSAANRIAFTSNRDGNWELYVMDASGGHETNLTHTPTIAENDAAWSPDGARLAFARQEAGNWDIYLMNADGSGLVRLTTHAAADRYPTWSPGGGRIAFQTDRDGNSEIYVLSANTPGNETNLTHSPADEREPAWSPDGTQIAFARDNAIYVMHLGAPAGATPQRLFYSGPAPQPAWRPFNLSPHAWLPSIRG